MEQFVGDWMARAAAYWPEKLAVVDAAKGPAGRYDYATLNRRANAVAHALSNHGVGRGDRVGMLALNGVEYLDVFFACGKIGAVFCPYNWRTTPTELTELVALTQPALLIFDQDCAELASSLSPALPRCSIDGHPPGAATYHQWLSGPAPAAANPSAAAEDIVCLLFTGGTTGLPKAAQISYRMIAWNTLNTVVHELRADDITLTHTPMFHTGGLFVYTLPLLTLGGTVVIQRRWQAEAMLELIERERVSMFFCVPSQFQLMLQAPRFAATSMRHVRFMTSGGAPLPVDIIRSYRQTHNVVFKQGFGMTEFGPGLFSMGPEHAEAKTGSIGRPNYFVAARIADDAGQTLPAGQVGELLLRGASGCSGYFGTTEPWLDEHGWFHTGDLAHIDDDGFFYIVDRKKDMFISGGENVYPVEIERALYNHPAIAQCAVVGTPDQQWGEVGAAFVVLRQGCIATAEELQTHCQSRIAKYKIPKHWRFVAQIPMSAAGKPLKRELKKNIG